MAEREIIVDRETLTYEGLFNAKDFSKMVFGWLKDHRYIPVEKRHSENLRPEGKYYVLEFEPFLKLSDYAKSIIKLHVEFQQVKDVTVERDGKKQKLQEGKILIQTMGILETDYEHRWETKPVYYFVRTIWEKYVYAPFISGHQKRVKSDVMSLKSHLKSYLNLETFQP
ncbi:hypothetical protein C4580_05310 [Candidatus Woesearchaeota archaeon]|nr:MAG: hypothetical protein C4580_05310 [Candidatus Woesearchaeota archaeon]